MTEEKAVMILWVFITIVAVGMMPVLIFPWIFGSMAFFILYIVYRLIRG